MNELWVEKNKHNGTKFIYIHLQTVTTTTKHIIAWDPVSMYVAYGGWGKGFRYEVENSDRAAQTQKRTNKITLQWKIMIIKSKWHYISVCEIKLCVPLPWQVPRNDRKVRCQMKNRFRANSKWIYTGKIFSSISCLVFFLFVVFFVYNFSSIPENSIGIQYDEIVKKFQGWDRKEG